MAKVAREARLGSGLLPELLDSLMIPAVGWGPRGQAAWVNSAALLGRMNFALDLVQQKLPGVKVDPTMFASDFGSLDNRLLFAEASQQTSSAVARAVAEGKDAGTLAALVLGSPEFQRR